MTVASPCTGVCTLDAAGVCLGCRRTLKEIAGWGSMSEAQRQAVVQAAQARTTGG